MSLSQQIIEYTDRLRDKGLFRRRVLNDSNRQSDIYFDSNDYLSLIGDSRIISVYEKAFKTSPNGSGASMVLSGYHPEHQLLERTVSELLGVDDCLIFSSGYAANLAVCSLLGQIRASCIIDKNCHASIYDGLSLAGIQFNRYSHNDLDNLNKVLNKTSGNVAVLTEGIFSMSGQEAPLHSMWSLNVNQRFDLFVDEAHSFGVIGRQGRGAVDHHQLTQKEVPLRVIPLGKACAAQGAVIAGASHWIEALLQAGRSFIYSTAISPALCYAVLKTIEIIVDADERRDKLKQLILYFNERRRISPLSWTESQSCIQQLRLGCAKKAMYYAEQLKKQGINCSAVRVPTVNQQASGLRIIINYKHTEKQIDKLFNELHLIYERTCV
ncbi:aminotransferase class I/II-fold pyridoxal phosphate-dependent enzyme [Legionella waltersii]|uniref:8-amino-7-oxononanoate synthase n=1 Tax=Legionella waltersii TaxID=66969 RepID=A0A0W1A164_9GAMM|nr:pyridoxal phosphate-dependent aminotransferase family protein [Legionella waltersii]KTD75122.1 8-amino-7-oxononanoate synthase [Legionella waltersii]SNV04962.1 8-amino-7-oxononanoate synthase [Legionella waltersii]